MEKIHVLHENDTWSAPLFEALSARSLPYEAWHLAEGRVAPAATPPLGVFYNRMSASSHTRDHRFAPELTASTLAWLEAHGRRVLNGSGAIRLEINKLAQYAGLIGAGIPVPRTIGAVGRDHVIAAARSLGETPFILKPNRGGAGAGVQRIDSLEALAGVLDDPATPAPLDGTWLVQQWIASPDATITRCEFIGGRFYYAVRVDSSDGFELCPADACAVPGEREKFSIIQSFDDPLLPRLAAFLSSAGVDVGAVELVRDREGRAFAYDVNTNTNYNARAEAGTGLSGMGRLADFLGEELARAHSAAA